MGFRVSELVPGNLLRNDPVKVPKLFPAFCAFPEEDLAFDEAATAVDFRNGFHFRRGEEVLYRGAEIGGVVARVGGHGDRDLAALDRPFDTDERGMNAVGSGDGYDDGVLDIGGVVRGAVALGAPRGAQGAVADGDDAVGGDEIEELRLLEVRVQFHLVAGRLDRGIAQDQFELGDGHVGRADVANEVLGEELFHGLPGLHEIRVDVRPCVRAAGLDTASWGMEIREGPMDEIEVEIIELKIIE